MESDTESPETKRIMIKVDVQKTEDIEDQQRDDKCCFGKNRFVN